MSLHFFLPCLILLLYPWCHPQTASAEIAPLWSVLEPGHRIRTAAFSPTQEVLATGSSEGEIKLWRMADGSLITTIQGGLKAITALAFSPDGARLASFNADQTVVLWSAEDWTKLASKADAAPRFATLAAAAFSLDGRRLLTSLDGPSSLGVWDVPELELLERLEGHNGSVNAIVFSPDGAVFASSSGIRGQDTTVKIWSAEDWTLLKSLQTANTYGIYAIAFSPDGKLLATGTDRTPTFAGNIQLWSTADWTLRQTLPAKGHALAFSPDGTLLASIDPSYHLNLWNTQNGTLLSRTHPPIDDFGVLQSVAWRPDGKALFYFGERYSTTTTWGHISAVPAPPALFATRTDENSLELNWRVGATLQFRTNWSSPWITLPGANPATATVDMEHPSAFFRLVSEP